MSNSQSEVTLDSCLDLYTATEQLSETDPWYVYLSVGIHMMQVLSCMQSTSASNQEV